MMCDEIERLLADYLGGELMQADLERVEEHLSACARCRDEVQSLRGTLSELATLPAVDLAEAARRTSGLEVRRRPSLARRVVFLSGGAAAAVLLGVLVGRLLAPPPPAPAPPPPSAVLHPGWVEAATRAMERGSAPSVPPW